ncbi:MULTISPECIES: ABC transporter permease [unclassified Streptomyces]|uniref:ABC transporter permease n=1 Tax=unclassified Streptomyces TaxID=2593676 RepID=UPI001661B302|nr:MULTISPECIES: ABC transporter permease [unclassified Streptomyces]MBD0840427.1 ABC transporter permease [Streptomyces sp. TRM68416]
MSVFAMALANVRALRRRLYGLMVMVAVASGVCLGALGVVDRAQSATDTGVTESAANRSITVDRPDDRPETPQLTDRTAERLAKLPHVASVEHRAQVSFGVSTEAGGTALLYATTYRSVLTPPVSKSVRERLFPLKPGEIVAPAASQGMDLSKLVGQEIEVETIRYVRPGEGTGVTSHARLVGVYDPSWQLDGPDAAYVADSTVIKWAAQRSGQPESEYLGTIGYDQLTVVARSAADVPGVMRSVQQLGYPAATLRQQLEALPAVLELVKVVGQVLLGVLGVLAFAGAVTVTGALSRRRAQEIGILKAVGFRTRAVLTMLVTEMALAGAVAALIGTALGAVFGAAGAALMRGSTDLAPYAGDWVPLPSPVTLLLLLALTVLVVTAGALGPARRAARMSPTDAMKDW